MRSSKILMIAVNVLTICAVFVLNYFYQSGGFRLPLKLTCSGLFALLGASNLLYAILSKQPKLPFYVSMSVGLVFAFLGDYFIYYDLIAGAIAFAFGHLCFILAYCFLEKLRLLDYLLSGALFVGCITFLLCCLPLAIPPIEVCIVCAFYALIITTMLGKSLGNAIRKPNLTTLTISFASFLFLFSDVMLSLGWFFPAWKWVHNACMGTYYPALCFLALAMLLKTLTIQPSTPNPR